MIQGKVIDSIDNSALPGANVYLSNSTGIKLHPIIGVASDNSGFYDLDTNLNPLATHVTASYVGYDKKIIPLSNISSGLTQIINFPLNESNTILPTFEVVTQKKKKFKTPILIGASLLALILGIIIYKNAKK